MTVSGAGLARVKAPSQVTEDSINEAVAAARRKAISRAVADARRRAEAHRQRAWPLARLDGCRGARPRLPGARAMPPLAPDARASLHRAGVHVRIRDGDLRDSRGRQLGRGSAGDKRIGERLRPRRRQAEDQPRDPARPLRGARRGHPDGREGGARERGARGAGIGTHARAAVLDRRAGEPLRLRPRPGRVRGGRSSAATSRARDHPARPRDRDAPRWWAGGACGAASRRGASR